LNRWQAKRTLPRLTEASSQPELFAKIGEFTTADTCHNERIAFSSTFRLAPRSLSPRGVALLSSRVRERTFVDPRHWAVRMNDPSDTNSQRQRFDAGENDADASKSSGQSACRAQPLDAVWRRFGDQLRRRARTRLRQYGLSGQAESMDICNDVMADLARRDVSGKMSPDDMLAYVMRAIDNQVLDTFRTLARQCRDFRRNEATPVEEMKVETRQATPSQIALRREVIDRIRTMMNPEDAVAVDMMLDNRDWNEIGQSLGVRADTARMRVRRAIDRVRSDLGFADGDT
jgi:RNA polymerase sigma factor (sigma-70 family)